MAVVALGIPHSVEAAAFVGGEAHVVMCAMATRRALQPLGALGAALALAQVAQTAKAENGADRALLAAFDKREVVELEGAQGRAG